MTRFRMHIYKEFCCLYFLWWLKIFWPIKLRATRNSIRLFLKVSSVLPFSFLPYFYCHKKGIPLSRSLHLLWLILDAHKKPLDCEWNSFAFNFWDQYTRIKRIYLFAMIICYCAAKIARKYCEFALLLNSILFVGINSTYLAVQDCCGIPKKELWLSLLLCVAFLVHWHQLHYLNDWLMIINNSIVIMISTDNVAQR